MLVSKSHSLKKELELLRKMIDSRDGSGKLQDDTD